MSSISGISSASSAWSDMSAMRSQMQARMFAKADADGSGGVDQTELQGVLDAVAEKTGVAGSTSTADQFAKMDGDGTTASADTSKSDELFAKLDSDGDGSLSQSEFDAGRPEAGEQTARASGGAPPAGGGGGGGGGGVSGVTTYDPLDTNEDGVVSLAERMAGGVSTDAVQSLFDAVDTDGDSKVSSAESDAFVKALSAQVDATDVSQQGTLASSKLVELVQRAYAQVAGDSVAPTQGRTIDVTT